MSRARSWTRMLGVLVLVGALAAVFAGPASAYTHKQKVHIRHQLLKQLKKHPRLIRNKHWLRKADHVQEVLPLTIRLNPLVNPAGGSTAADFAASNDTAALDLSDTFGPEVGSKVTTLSGVVNVDAHFGNPQDGDTLGSLRLVVTGANLSAASVGVLENAAAAACPAASAAPDWTYTQGGTVGAPNAQALAPSVNANSVVRTAPISLSLANTAAPNVGTANLFSTSNNVRLSLHVNAAVNTIFRILDDGSGGGALPAGTLPTGNFNCDSAIAGQTTGSGATGNVIPVNVTGSLQISPALTMDGKLRIATVNVSTPAGTGEEVGHSTVDACLQPTSLVDTAQANTDVSNFVTATGIPSPVVPVTATTQPTTDCDATFSPVNFPLAQLGETEITPTTAKRLHLDPNVDVLGLTAEALIGTYGS